MEQATVIDFDLIELGSAVEEAKAAKAELDAADVALQAVTEECDRIYGAADERRQRVMAALRAANNRIGVALGLAEPQPVEQAE